MVLFRQSAGNNANYARMPAATRQNQRRVVFGIEHFFQLLLGRQIDAAFQAVAAVVPARANTAANAVARSLDTVVSNSTPNCA